MGRRIYLNGPGSTSHFPPRRLAGAAAKATHDPKTIGTSLNSHRILFAWVGVSFFRGGSSVCLLLVGIGRCGGFV